jgi:TPR repeat protein
VPVPRSAPVVRPKPAAPKPGGLSASGAVAATERRTLPADAKDQYAKALQQAETTSAEEHRRGLAQLESLAKAGYLPAEEKLGELLALSTAAGANRDDAGALLWHRAAAAHGSRGARLALARRLERGDWTPAESASAPKPQGRACRYLGVLCGGGKEPDAPDPEADFMAWLMAQSPVQNRPAELKEAYGLYLGLARQKVSEAQERLAYMLFAGRGTAAKRYDGFLWLRLAAAGGRTEAQYALGKLYLSGYAYPANREAALCWLQRAAAHSERARKALTALGETAATAARQDCDFPPHESPL